MASLIVDARDQRFILHEMLNVEELCTEMPYVDFSKGTFDMILTEAEKLASEELYPIMAEADREGCRLVDGQVYLPKCYQRPYKLYCQGGWNAMGFPTEIGGQGLPAVVRGAAHEWFLHNFAFVVNPGLAEGAAHLIEVYGTEEQKQKYLPKMVSGEWGGTMCLTEPNAGSDVGNLSTKAFRLPDGTYRIQGTKQFISSADQDLTENIIHPVLARIEGDPAGTKGISIFLVPKYIVNADGSLGRRNDYEIAKIEEKMGLHASATCVMNFGDNGDCYGELLGQERDGMKVMFQMMNEARLGVGLQSLAAASIAYLHALKYAKERQQGAAILEFKNADAPRVPIIEHLDVRRMLLWMKTNVESLRAMAYFIGYCIDKAHVAQDEAGKDKWQGLLEVLTPIIKAYGSDIAFRVVENAMQVHGGYGFCAEYPIEQYLRDVKIASIYEGANGIQALDLIGRKLGMKKGAYFMTLIGEMQAMISKTKDIPVLKDLTEDFQGSMNTLTDLVLFFGQCGKEGKFLIPISQAYPFLMLMGKVVSAWLLLWQAGIAHTQLDALAQAKGASRQDQEAWKGFIKENQDAAYYAGKLSGAQYFIKNVLPEVEAAAKAIKSEDLSIAEIAQESFAA
ncbi:MAG: acyl-CoA dehydrogenase [Syntrophaceae bacterium]